MTDILVEDAAFTFRISTAIILDKLSKLSTDYIDQLQGAVPMEGPYIWPVHFGQDPGTLSKEARGDHSVADRLAFRMKFLYREQISSVQVKIFSVFVPWLPNDQGLSGSAHKSILLADVHKIARLIPFRI